MSEKKVEEEK